MFLHHLLHRWTFLNVAVGSNGFPYQFGTTYELWAPEPPVPSHGTPWMRLVSLRIMNVSVFLEEHPPKCLGDTSH